MAARHAPVDQKAAGGDDKRGAANHYLDAFCYGLSGIEFVSLDDWKTMPADQNTLSRAEAARDTGAFTMPDGREYLVTNR